MKFEICKRDVKLTKKMCPLKNVKHVHDKGAYFYRCFIFMRLKRNNISLINYSYYFSISNYTY